MTFNSESFPRRRLSLGRALMFGVLLVSTGACGDPITGNDAGGMDNDAGGALADGGDAGRTGPIIEEIGGRCCGHQVGLALGPAGEVRMIGMDARTDSLWFASRDGGTWTEEEVATNPNTTSTAFAVSSDDSPHILYTRRQAPSPELTYAWRSGAGWTETPITESAQFYDIAVDSGNAPHVVYFDPDTSSLMYAAWNGTTFDLSPIDQPAAVDDVMGEHASVAVSASGAVHVSYRATLGGTDTLRHAVGPGAWTITDVPGAAIGLHGTMMLDDVGEPHIVSSDVQSTRGRGVFWSRLTGGVWSETEIDASFAVASMDAALDSSGRPHVFVGRLSVGDFGTWNYIRNDGSAWQTTERPRPEIPPGGFDPGPAPPPESVAIAIDAAGATHLGIPGSYIRF